MMERLLQRDAVVRVLSVMLALSLWFYAASGANPTDTRTIKGVRVQAEDLKSDLAAVSIDPREVTVTLRGPRAAVDSLSREDLTGSVQLADARPGPVVASVRVPLPEGLQLVEIVPNQVIALIQPVQEVRFAVEVAVTGRAAPDYRVGDLRVSPRQVLVRGPASLAERVSRVVTNVDVDGARESLRTRLTLYPIDASGRQVTGVEVLPQQVRARVPVEPLPPLTAVPVYVPLEGRPAEGFALVGDPVARPAYAVVRAEAGLRGRLTRIATQPVDVAGARQPVEQTVSLELPDGVEAVGSPEVRVYVAIGSAGP